MKYCELFEQKGVTCESSTTCYFSSLIFFKLKKILLSNLKRIFYTPGLWDKIGNAF